MTETRAAGDITPMVTEEAFDARTWERGAAPVFPVNVVSTIFFGMSQSWLRHKLKPTEKYPQTAFLRPDGTPMVFRRSDPERTDSARVFTIADIEPMAWSLARLGVIGPDRLARTLRVVEAVGMLYKLIPVPGEDDEEAEPE